MFFVSRSRVRAFMGHAISSMQQWTGTRCNFKKLKWWNKIIVFVLFLSWRFQILLQHINLEWETWLYCANLYSCAILSRVDEKKLHAKISSFLTAWGLLIETNWVDWAVCMKNALQSKVLVEKMSAIQNTYLGNYPPKTSLYQMNESSTIQAKTHVRADQTLECKLETNWELYTWHC